MLERFSKCVATFVVTLLVASGSLHSPIAFADAADSAARWVATGDLNVARTGHTATLLSNGKVLVAGGFATNGDALDSAELYDPGTGVWSVTGWLHAARVGHTATLLPDGKVLVVGGVWRLSTANVLYVAELYDPTTGTWSRTGNPTANRSYHTATLLQSGNVLVTGGTGGDLYNPISDTWNVIGSLSMPRYSDTATLLPNGQVLVAGGYNDYDFDPLNRTFIDRAAPAESYDPVAGRWIASGQLNFPRASHTATLLSNGKVLVAGGYSDNPSGFPKTAELFDPVAGRWVQTGALGLGRAEHTATLLPDGQVLLVGGYYGDRPVESSGAEVYDPASATWHNTANLNTARHAHTATLLSNGKVLIAGGGGGTFFLSSTSAVLRSAELYESGSPSTPSARTIGPGTTGSWYDPGQSGHGFALEVLAGPPQRLLAYWFTFSPQGGQSWIAALGPIDGNRAVLQGVQTVGAGARFPPNFDAANARQDSWGTLTFTFSDCDHGHVDWNATAPGYGNGGMDLTRLTLPAGLTCSP